MTVVAVKLAAVNIVKKAIVKMALLLLLSMGIVMATENDKTLALCSESPNCVSSQAPDDAHFVAPFKIVVPVKNAWETLQSLLKNQSRTKLINITENQLNAEVTSLVFRFVDDVQVILNAEEKLIHIRSASRTGYSDLGVNRKRVESFRTQLQQAGIIE